MKLAEVRPGVFTATMTAHELSVLVAGARMSLAMTRLDENDANQMRPALEAVLEAFDAAVKQKSSAEQRAP
jgi:hypothetical protein